MFIYEIIIPGVWLDYDDRDWARRIERQLRSLENIFFEANTALNLFDGARSIFKDFDRHESWERDRQRRVEIRREIEKEFGYEISFESLEALDLEAEIRFKREKWAGGATPIELKLHMPFIYARAFLYALDAFDKFLGVLAAEPGVPARVSELHKKIAAVFPNLRGVRNTAQHLEDRSRGLGAGRIPQQLQLKPVKNNMFEAPGGVLALNCLNGSKYGSTMSDGHYGEIDVSPESMQYLHGILQELNSLFNWSGPKRHAPNI